MLLLLIAGEACDAFDGLVTAAAAAILMMGMLWDYRDAESGGWKVAGMEAIAGGGKEIPKCGSGDGVL